MTLMSFEKASWVDMVANCEEKKDDMTQSYDQKTIHSQKNPKRNVTTLNQNIRLHNDYEPT